MNHTRAEIKPRSGSEGTSGSKGEAGSHATSNARRGGRIGAVSLRSSVVRSSLFLLFFVFYYILFDFFELQFHR
jgi:hypothetical protein